ncbi:hypothetical protein ABT354_18005 [Streptomyces sp. NPDC000594]|uniref:hypothetical protein n=1 Tax=Streptomyces sp. NPDC000594 TaxID=3154261 RepID=UPI0033297663
MILVLLGVLALTVFGCVCVVWAPRGGPRWTHGVAAVTRAAGALVGRSGKSRSGNGNEDGAVG